MTGAQQGGGVHRVLGLLPLGLHALQRAQAAVHGAHHEGVLAAAALGPGEVVDEAGGAAQRVLGVEFGGDDHRVKPGGKRRRRVRPRRRSPGCSGQAW